MAKKKDKNLGEFEAICEDMSFDGKGVTPVGRAGRDDIGIHQFVVLIGIHQIQSGPEAVVFLLGGIGVPGFVLDVGQLLF